MKVQAHLKSEKAIEEHLALRIDLQLDRMLENFENCFQAREYRKVNDILATVIPGQQDDAILLGYLSFTFIVKHRLPARRHLFDRARAYFIKKHGRKYTDEQMLMGLE